MTGPGLRVTAGALRGRRLAVGPQVRPTEGRVREALMSIWQDRLAGARVLDLFAGSGSVGIEAISRGAAAVLFFEQSPAVLRLLEENAELVERSAAKIRRGVLPGGLRALAEHPDRRFDLIFADPPYSFSEYDALLSMSSPLLASGGELAIEHSSRVELAAAAGELRRVGSRCYGECALSFYRSSTDGDAVVRGGSGGEEEGDFLEVDP